MTFSLFDLAFLGSLTGGAAYDADAQAYITAVEAADGQALEVGVKDAINAFVVGCKADGIWAAIKASCILAGARTLSGALVPLVGTAPTNFNFVAGDYNRETGLVGNGSTKYLNTNRPGNADPQNNSHCAVNVHTADTTGGNTAYAGDAASVAGSTNIGVAGGIALFFRSRSAAYVGGGGNATGLIGVSRSSGSSYDYRSSGSTTNSATASDGVSTASMFIFGRNSSGFLGFPSNGRINFYSIGEAIDLALLDARVTDLITAIGAAIP